MPKNIEIKARLHSPAATRRVLKSLGANGPQILRQRDTFYACPHGRLKIRECAGQPAELILYLRPDCLEPKSSNYVRFPIADLPHTRRLLNLTHGQLGVVRKVRQLYLLNETRIHLDRVHGLGDFLELEVLTTHRSPVVARTVARRLMSQLNIEPGDLVSVAYFDLLNGSQGGN